jgi:hypothetical protein
MAPRSSLYSSALQIPDWVYGGEFGDLSGVMNARDISYENVAQEQQQTEENDFNLEARRRKERMRDILNERAGQSRPATIREAYEQMINAAYESGDPVAAMELEGKKQDYEQAQLNKRRAEVTGAISLADNMDFNRIEELYPGVLTKSDYDRNQKRKKAEGVKSSDMVVVMNTTTGAKDRIPWSEARSAQSMGWEVDPSNSRQEQILDDIRAKREEMENPPSPSWGSRIWGVLNPTAPESAPAPSSPSPQDGKGDRARQLPSVGDQVKVIKRERSVAR